VRNILDFPCYFSLPAKVIALEHNYRSTQPILDAANAVIAQTAEQIAKTLYSTKASAERPFLATVEDEAAQARYVADSVLDHREAGIALRRQAVLFRTAHHSDLLEIELGRRNLPFVKYGGLKFLEAAHVKDVLAILRWAENPRDSVAAFRALQLLPGIGPAIARAVLIQQSDEAFAVDALARFSPPAAAAVFWPGLCRVIARLRDANTLWHGQIGLVRDWYQPLLERLYDYWASRAGDLDQLEQIASGYASRERFLTELTLDPPDASGAEAARPLLDEDYLILSTIHCKGAGVGHCVYPQSCGRLHTLGHGDRQTRADRRGAPATLRGDDAGAGTPSSGAASALLSNPAAPAWSWSRPRTTFAAFCRRKSSPYLPALSAGRLPPPPMGTPLPPYPGSTSPSGFARCGAKARGTEIPGANGWIPRTLLSTERGGSPIFPSRSAGTLRSAL
jgi:UvrD-like helicase family protein